MNITPVPQIAQVNHDLNLLYTIARTIIPKDILEGLMYGSDFDEPTREDFEFVKQLAEANKAKRKRKAAKSKSIAIETDTQAEGLWKEQEEDFITYEQWR